MSWSSLLLEVFVRGTGSAIKQVAREFFEIALTICLIAFLLISLLAMGVVLIRRGAHDRLFAFCGWLSMASFIATVVMMGVTLASLGRGRSTAWQSRCSQHPNRLPSRSGQARRCVAAPATSQSLATNRTMQLEPYRTQSASWPPGGRHILACHDDASIVVYQAFRPQIVDEAVQLGRFGPSFSRSRMSWIKPNFLWMMYRCGWATKPDQERVLAVRITRPFFDRLLAMAVPAKFDERRYGSYPVWQAAVQTSTVRLQWDPDHDPLGRPLRRRALQLGLRGHVLAEYASDAIVAIEDVTPLVVRQCPHAVPPFDNLLLPVERPFTPGDPHVARALGLAPSGS